MTKYDLSRLDSQDFENLCADIIEEEAGQRVERFSIGRDGGIDGRFWLGNDRSAIIQAKHRPDAKTNSIIAILKSEVVKVQNIKPERYIFMTSGKLTPLAKTKIQAVLPEYINTPTDIWGFDGIQSFLSKEENFDIVKKYTPLYIYSEPILKKVLGQTIAGSLIGGLQGQSTFLLENIKKNSKRFVYTEDFDKARDLLDEKNVVVITGEAGIGKTTLSNVLAFVYVKKGYAFYSIRNISEAEDIVSAKPKDSIVFYFDDFLGENFMDITKGDDSSQVMLFMDRVARSKKLKFILNSRTTIINRARGIFPSLEKGNIGGHEYLLQIENLKPIDKARMLYKHMYFSALDTDYLDEIYHEKKYWKIINHGSFNPRIIEYILDKKRVEFANISNDDYFTYIEEKLDNPSDIWGDYFEKLDKCTQALVLLVSFNNGRVSESNLRNSFVTYCEANGFSSKDEYSFEYVTKVAIDSLLTRNTVFYSDEFEYRLFNPSLGDYIIENHFKNNTSEIGKLLFALSNVTSIEYLESLKSNNCITSSEFKSLQKKLFETLSKEKLDEEEWDWLICVIYSEVSNLDYETVVSILSKLAVLNKEKSQSLTLNSFHKLHSVLTHFESVVPKEYNFLWAYLNNNVDSYDFESFFSYFNEKQILDDELLERLAELYEDHIIENIEDYLDIDYTRYVDFIAPDDYSVDSYAIKTEILETIQDNFLDSDREEILNMTSFNADSVVERMDDDYVSRAEEMLKDSAKESEDEDRHRSGITGSKEEIDELFRKD